ncbi:Phosphate ABC transporter, inner membrane subunit PstC [uncultured Alphaproteobacteria bacterium]|uniref:Phosphate transport system permease protein n=1 Tax=uncultured Alphaproteobacteria bacterium TaxID=91750 RepID=A0A212KM36_9PROT|nr:Phosphate ABC transporter, inner membrane subunit PstC [uncultured Alphaproteobacteria bacterium]
MPFSLLLLVLAGLAVMSYRFGTARARAVAPGRQAQLHSRPMYHGLYAAMWCGVPALLISAVWLMFQPVLVKGLVLGGLPESYSALPEARLNLVWNDIRNLALGDVVRAQPAPEIQAAADAFHRIHAIGDAALAVVCLCLAIGGAYYALKRVSMTLRARNRVEAVITVFLVASSLVAILTTVGIVLSLLFESLRFFAKVPPLEFLFGLHWSPQTALRADQVGSSGSFGAVPLFTGTLLISLISMCVAVPVGLMSAIYMSEYAHRKFRAVAKPLLEILAGIPTVVYGFFAALTVAPFIRRVGEGMGLSVASESALAAGLVMGVMIIPFVSSISDDVINAVPQAMRDGAYALGATRSETIRNVIVPAALPGIVGGVLLAVSRAIGETMIVVMAAGLSANLTFNPLDAVTTVTVQIVTLLTGDQEFDSAKTLAAFALGLVLFCVTLGLNILALHVVRKYREQYE